VELDANKRMETSMHLKTQNIDRTAFGWRIYWIILVSAVFFLALVGFSSKFLTTAIFAQSGNLPQAPSQVIIANQRIGPNTAAEPASEVKYTTTFLSALQPELDFSILQPKELPQGTELVTTRKVESIVDGIAIELQYRLPNGSEIWITESNPPEPIHLYIEKDKIIEQVSIHGNRGVLYKIGAPSESLLATQILTWTDGERWFELRGTVGFDELIKVAQSIAP